jgi:transposase
MFQERTSVGLDVHARSIVAAGIDGVTGELYRRRLVPQPEAVIEWLGDLPGPVAVSYEAGPTGYDLYRRLSAAGYRCVIAAPSKLVRPSGDRVKTDARDAMLLARLLRMDELVAVRVPSIDQESARDLVRAREDVRAELMAARHRVSKLLLRHGHLYSGGTTWTGKHHHWLGTISFPTRGTQAAYEAAREELDFALARRNRLDATITELAGDSEFTAITRRLGCLRGISTLTAFALAVEIGEWDRFTGSSIGAYLGLTPSEYSSGESRRQGGITKSGNTHVRRLLIESAWQHKGVYRVGAVLQRRWDQAPPAARARGHLGNERLHRRWQTFAARSKPHNVANVAIARELAGWCWSLATLNP